MWKGHIRFQTPMLYAIGFISLFVSSGLSGPFLAAGRCSTFNCIRIHGYFVVGHFHSDHGSVAAIFGIFAATYYWFLKMFGRMMNEPLGKPLLHHAGRRTPFFMLMHYLGMAGQDTAIFANSLRSGIPGEAAAAADVHHLCGDYHDCGAVHFRDQPVLEHVQKDRRPSDNPWELGDDPLRWTTATPPPHDQFLAEWTPVVHRPGPYEYGAHPERRRIS